MAPDRRAIRDVTDRAESLLSFPPRPASEFEWEDLLVRIEMMPRVLRVAMEDVSPDDPEIRSLVGELVDQEIWTFRFLEEAAAHAEGWAVDSSSTAHVPAPLDDDGVRRFERLRAKNFAILQRRGIAVWEWRPTSGEDSGPTVHQLLAHLAECDVATLGRIRTAVRGSDAC